MTSIIDVSAAVAVLSVDAISVSRTTRSFNSAGVLVLAAPATIDMVVSVQPTESGTDKRMGRNTMQSVHGQREFGGIAIYSRERLYGADESGNVSDDVTWNGIVYTVEHVEPWLSAGYYRSTCTKKVV
jgi:hypothetical protein